MREVQERDANGNLTRHLVDGLGRELATQDAAGSWMQFAYDAKNKLSQSRPSWLQIGFARPRYVMGRAGSRRGGQRVPGTGGSVRRIAAAGERAAGVRELGADEPHCRTRRIRRRGVGDAPPRG
jgi:YD repeat-containing protein